jgi:hypothetical protein
MMSGSSTPNLNAIASLTLLIAWKVWNERNARVFHNKQAPSHVVFDKIKKESCLWIMLVLNIWVKWGRKSNFLCCNKHFYNLVKFLVNQYIVSKLIHRVTSTNRARWWCFPLDRDSIFGCWMDLFYQFLHQNMLRMNLNSEKIQATTTYYCCTCIKHSL